MDIWRRISRAFTGIRAYKEDETIVADIVAPQSRGATIRALRVFKLCAGNDLLTRMTDADGGECQDEEQAGDRPRSAEGIPAVGGQRDLPCGRS